MNRPASRKTNGPAKAATFPDHGSTNPLTEECMNTCMNSMGGDHAATIAAYVAAEFEPYALDFPSSIPSNSKWAADGVEFLPTVRLAAVVLTKTKAKLIVGCESEAQEAMMDLYDGCISLRDYFSGLSTLCEQAGHRLLVALTIVAEREGGEA